MTIPKPSTRNRSPDGGGRHRHPSVRSTPWRVRVVVSGGAGVGSGGSKRMAKGEGLMVGRWRVPVALVVSGVLAAACAGGDDSEP